MNFEEFERRDRKDGKDGKDEGRGNVDDTECRNHLRFSQ
jgi:hypothetical protein